ncbi:MAG: Dot/Icm T4SS effector Wip [Legionella sp.]
MAIGVVSKAVSLRAYPNCQNRPTGNNLIIGDLHGNALKLLFFLLHEGICSLSANDYELFVQLYHKPCSNLTADDLQKFNAVINQMTVMKHDTLIRILGDELADRGSNDYFTLKIIDALHHQKVPVEIVLSNHSLGFVEAYELRQVFEYTKLGKEQAKSMYNLQYLIEKNLISKQDIENTINNSYKKLIKPLSYSLSLTDNSITIYSHAAIDIQVIKFLAQKLQVSFADNNPAELAKTIDIINKKFSNLANHNAVSTLYNRETIGRDVYQPPSPDNPIEMLTWNRGYQSINRQPQYKSYTVNYVHGHDIKGPSKDNIYNLDNTLGRGDDANNCHGMYHVIYSNEALTLKEAQKSLFNQQLDALAQEIQALKACKQLKACHAAQKLHDNLKKLADIYFSDNASIQSYREFKQYCYYQIGLSRKELEAQYGIKKIINDILSIIIDFSIYYLKLDLSNIRHLFFTNNSEHILKHLNLEHENFEPTLEVAP